jgi:hypothetical protein
LSNRPAARAFDVRGFGTNGFTPIETITAIRGKHTRGVPPEDAQIIDFTLQLIRKHRVEDAAFNAM